MNSQSETILDFGPYRLDAGRRLLLRDGKAVALTPRVFDTLLVLIENRGRIVEKDELMRALWPDSFVEEGNLAQNIFQLRKVLGEGDSTQHYIETVPKRGYCFVAKVTELNGTELVYPTEQPSRNVEIDLNHLPLSSALNLRALLLAVLLVGMTLGGLYFLSTNGIQSDPTPDETVRSIAVLPFKPLVAHENDEQLRLGMTDALITKLSNLRELAVRPTRSVFRYGDPNHDPLQAGRELAVDSVLDGTIQLSEERIRVTVQLLRVRDGISLWADQFDEEFTDLFAIQDSISEQVSRALAIRLTSDERSRMAKRYTQNTEAYQAYIKGRYFWNKRTEEGLQNGIEYFKKAIDLDPTYALAYAGLADSYNMLSYYCGIPSAQTYPRARVAAIKALELDDTLAEAHTSLAYVKMLFDWDWAGAEIEFKKALEFNPNYVLAHLWYSEYLRTVGRFEEAITHAEIGLKLDPLSVPARTNSGRVYLMAGQYEKAVAQLKESLVMEPTNAFAKISLGRAYAEQGNIEEGLALVKQAQQLSEGGAATVVLGYIYSRSGRLPEVRKLLREMQSVSQRRYVPAYTFAMLYADLGEKDQAFKWLEKAYEERSEFITMIKVDPRFNSLRTDSRFNDLVVRVGFEPLPIDTARAR